MTSKKGERAPRPASRKPCRFFHQNNCFRGDKCHMVHVPKASLPACQTHLFWMEDPWSRPACEWGEDCTFPHPKHEGPEDPGLLRTNIALQTENSQLARVREYASGVLGKGGEAFDTGTARSGTSRLRQKLALLEARDPQDFSRKCVSDPSLCRVLLRVYLLGGGVCTSLEDAGKAVSEEVATGKYHVGSSPAGTASVAVTSTTTLAGGATPPSLPPQPPLLCVRVQALPKAMELQLIDEDSTFWDENFPNLCRERQAGAFTHVLSVVFARGAFLWGLAEAATHGRSIIDNSVEDKPVCRAFYKIKEIAFRADLCFGEDWTVIDVGAAPGGWTSFLASKCRRVLAVDPAELDPSVLALPNVVHIQRVIQGAKGTLLGLLAETSPRPQTTKAREGLDANEGRGPVGLAAPETAAGVDMVVSDMNAEPKVVADVLLSAMAAGLARPGALVVATFKDFCGRHKRMRDEVALAVARLEAGTAGEGGGGAVDVAGEGNGSPAAPCAGPGAADARAAGDDFSEAAGGTSRVAPAHGVTHPEAAETTLPTPCGTEGEETRGTTGVRRSEPAGGGSWWRLEGIETMKLLAGGQAEVTIVARVACGKAVCR